jgi:hypothetical protein
VVVPKKKAGKKAPAKKASPAPAPKTKPVSRAKKGKKAEVLETLEEESEW